MVKFKPGDKVRILRKPTEQEVLIHPDCRWANEMDKTLNMIGEVKEVSGKYEFDNKRRVRVAVDQKDTGGPSNPYGWAYHEDCLWLIDQAKQGETTPFRVGDRVIITRRATQDEYPNSWCWVDDMDQTVGHIGRVCSFNKDLICVTTNVDQDDLYTGIERSFWYPSCCLKLFLPYSPEPLQRKLEQKFFLVWNPDGPTTPSVCHETEFLAEQEAKRLAESNAGQQFYVLEAKGRATVSRVVYEVLDPAEDDIPF